MMKKGNILKKDQILFLTRLSDMLKQGFTLMESVQLLTDQFSQLSRLRIKEKLIEIVKNTGQLHEVVSFLNYPQVIITQIYFGEQYGNMIDSIDHSILYLKKIEQVKQKFIKTIQYPTLLFFIFFMLLTAVNHTIIPQFNEIYQSMNINVSTSLKVLSTIFSYLPTSLLIIFLIAILTLLLGYFFYIGIEVSKKIYFFNKIPILNQYISMYRSYRLSRDFSFFIQNGIPLHKIIEIYIMQTKDDVLKYIGLFIQQSIKSGDSLPQAINNLNCFDSTLIQYITHGEHKSKLDLELYYFSVYMLEKLEKSIIKHLKWVQPIVFGTLAFLIVTLYLIIILPMLQMVDGIK
ncbi:MULTISPECIES: competence type IV pilus assembly protein ComGB [Mammaliicoccus]|uniref:competence type IV pilus assembly protein ComGB n=2 Tax=Mammaliicoccus TaxID=2803850 RepID=UPI001EFA7363|nr:MULTISPECIES: competence type IV pilus assembly protein ComGB [Mammaliicoccus]WHI55917.1 competence type IV pilus assembly protein ComGB [Mammaliicoccus lentus]WHI58437.1 competence type IV pilus assembly protein ComGB [Mammaliicoccus lentus]WHI66284.1 competence type IV pilus assembly protein ComGB [Mammaliicoccus lentus]WHI87176.1 competence type IV pilus assembly protein ComGB [Mammaliicoccus lentus]WHI91684.1 competence type IV pilus assembly protein ComGB [Mammaliicoccus lentus]